MNIPTKETFLVQAKAARVKARLTKELRFVPEDVSYPKVREMLAITTRSGQEGVLLIELPHNQQPILLPFALSNRITDSRTGRSRSITCDLCYTWQAGSNAARISCERARDKTSFTLLVCADLNCSLHIRGLTPQAVLSRSQLREDITAEQRIARFREKLDAFLNTLSM